MYRDLYSEEIVKKISNLKKKRSSCICSSSKKDGFNFKRSKPQLQILDSLYEMPKQSSWRSFCIGL